MSIDYGTLSKLASERSRADLTESALRTAKARIEALEAENVELRAKLKGIVND
jgi:hypothetical protein